MKFNSTEKLPPEVLAWFCEAFLSATLHGQTPAGSDQRVAAWFGAMTLVFVSVNPSCTLVLWFTLQQLKQKMQTKVLHLLQLVFKRASSLTNKQ